MLSLERLKAIEKQYSPSASGVKVYLTSVQEAKAAEVVPNSTV